MDIISKIKDAAMGNVTVDPDAVRSHVVRWSGQSPDGATADVHRQAAHHHALQAAKRGFVTGLVPGVVGSALVSLIDAKGVAHQRASLTATYAYLADPNFFERPDYPERIARSLSEGDLVRGDDIHEGWARSAVRFHATAYAARALRRAALRWAAKRLIGGVPGLMMPVVGATVGAAWNYAELRVVAWRYDNDPRTSVAAARSESETPSVADPDESNSDTSSPMPAASI